LVGAILFIHGCQADAPEVFPLSELATDVRGVTPSGVAYKIRREYFVVAHPPSDRGEIRRLVDAYLASQPSIDVDVSYAAIIRNFYRETARTPRDYKEANGGYFDRDRIEDHAEDILVVVKSFPAEGRRDFIFYSPDELP
jgi:hypothetical protein